MGNSKIEETQETIVKETQHETTSVNSMTDAKYDQETIAKNSNRIIEMLKKVIELLKRNLTLTTIVGIIAAVAAVWAVWPKPENDRLKDEINQRVSIIETSFHPNEIHIDSLSSPERQLIKDFQVTALGVVKEWKKINTMEPIAEYGAADLQMLLNVILDRLNVINAFDSETKNVQSSVSKIIDYGQKNNNIQQLVRGADKLTLLYVKAGKRDEIFSNTKQTLINDFTQLLTKSATDPNSITKKKVAKVIAPLDELYNNRDVLDYTNTLFSWIIEMNTDYMDYLNYSKNK